MLKPIALHPDEVETIIEKHLSDLSDAIDCCQPGDKPDAFEERFKEVRQLCYRISDLNEARKNDDSKSCNTQTKNESERK